MEKKRIADMEIGEIGFIFPGSLWMDRDNQFHLNEDHEAYPISTPTRDLKIRKVKNGYVVLINETRHVWAACDIPPFINTEPDLCFGKVVGFNDNTPDQFRLQVLNQQLQEAVDKEDYEEAAKIRDKIRKEKESKLTSTSF